MTLDWLAAERHRHLLCTHALDPALPNGREPGRPRGMLEEGHDQTPCLGRRHVLIASHHQGAECQAGAAQAVGGDAAGQARPVLSLSHWVWAQAVIELAAEGAVHEARGVGCVWWQRVSGTGASPAAPKAHLLCWSPAPPGRRPTGGRARHQGRAARSCLCATRRRPAPGLAGAAVTGPAHARRHSPAPGRGGPRVCALAVA